MSKYSMEQPPSKQEEKRRRIVKLKKISTETGNKTYLKTKEQGIPVPMDKILFVSGLIGQTGVTKQEVNIALAELIREKIITIEKENKKEIIFYYPPQEIIDGKKDKPAGLSEKEIDDIIYAKPIQSFPNISICKNCHFLTHDKKGQEGICAKCGKNRKGETAK